MTTKMDLNELLALLVKFDHKEDPLQFLALLLYYDP